MRYVDLFRFCAQASPDREFACDGRRSISYADAERTALQIANGLRAAGLDVNARASILANNSIEFALFCIGCGLAGVVPTPLNVRLVGPEIHYILDDSGSQLIVAGSEYVDLIDSLRSELPELRTFVVTGSEHLDGWVDLDGW